MYKKVNKFLCFVILFGTLFRSIFYFQISHLFTYLCAIPLVLVPVLFEKVLKLEDFDKFIYYLFIFLAYLLGCVFDLYNITWWYDLVMHTTSGVVTGYLGVFILRILGFYQKKKVFFNFLFCISFVLAIAGLWEIVEFLADRVAGTNFQHHLDTGVLDTMEDMLCGFGGGLFYYIFHIMIKGSKK